MRSAAVLAGLLWLLGALLPCFPASAAEVGRSRSDASVPKGTSHTEEQQLVSSLPAPDASHPDSPPEVNVPATCLVAVPKGECPNGGWPVFVLLHGYGANKEDFDAVAQVVAAHGAAAICIDGPNDLGGGRRSWDSSIESTHAYLQKQITPFHVDPRFDFEPIHLGGFSQGAGRSLLLIVNYEPVYGGALSVSP